MSDEREHSHVAQDSTDLPGSREQTGVWHTLEASEYYFKEGCHILEYHNRDEDEAVSIARARVEAGKRTRKHALTDTTERYLILKGAGRVLLNDEEEVVSVGSVVLIPPGVVQCIENTGESDLEFLAICSPRFQEEVYQDKE